MLLTLNLRRCVDIFVCIFLSVEVYGSSPKPVQIIGISHRYCIYGTPLAHCLDLSYVQLTILDEKKVIIYIDKLLFIRTCMWRFGEIAIAFILDWQQCSVKNCRWTRHPPRDDVRVHIRLDEDVALSFLYHNREVCEPP